MSKKKFTEAEIAILRENPYTLAVTPDRITYTREFKQLFWADYQKRMRLGAIFRKYGYDPAMIGRGRMTGLQQSLKREFDAGLEFYEGRRPVGLRKKATAASQPTHQSTAPQPRAAREKATAADDPDTALLREMQRKLDELGQELDFLKKIFLVARTNAKKSKGLPKKSSPRRG